MPHMLEATRDELFDVLVVEVVEHVAPFFAAFDQSHLPQMPQMVGRCRLTQLRLFS